MPEKASDIIVTGAKVFYSAVGTALPANTLAADQPWPAGWTYVGYTLEPLKVGYKYDVLEIMVQQTHNPVKRSRIKEETAFETSLAEHTAGNLALALAGESSETAATPTTPGFEEFTVGGDQHLPVKQWGFEGTYVDDDENLFPVRAFIWRATPSEGAELEYDREKATGIPLRLKGLADTTKPRKQHLMKIVRITAPAG